VYGFTTQGILFLFFNDGMKSTMYSPPAWQVTSFNAKSFVVPYSIVQSEVGAASSLHSLRHLLSSHPHLYSVAITEEDGLTPDGVFLPTPNV
jgi:hypothetical protein